MACTANSRFRSEASRYILVKDYKHIFHLCKNVYNQLFTIRPRTYIVRFIKVSSDFMSTSNEKKTAKETDLGFSYHNWWGEGVCTGSADPGISEELPWFSILLFSQTHSCSDTIQTL